MTSASKTTVFTQELRFSTPAENRWRVTAGGFYSDLELQERNDFAYTGNVLAQPFGPFAPNFPQDGFTSAPGPFPADTIFRNDIRRTDGQFGIFGEAPSEVPIHELPGGVVTNPRYLSPGQPFGAFFGVRVRLN